MPAAPLPINATAASSSACRRPVTKTLAPRADSSRAEARPMPALPPVTNATFPFSDSFMFVAPFESDCAAPAID
jgi:hypothetical protein